MTAVKVAYFSMEIALWSDVPNYAGGLGVLAADMMHSFADLDYPAVGVSLIYHQDDDLKKGFNPETVMKRVPEMVEVTIENRQVKVGAFVHQVKGISGKTVPIYFLTTNLSENPRWDRDLTKDLYASSNAYTRLGQEVILGIGGVRMLRKLGYATIENFHMNEGHSAFLTLERLKEEQGDVAAVKKSCTFTTHTPVPEGHDHFDYVLVYQVLGSLVPANIRQLATDQSLSMTHLALNLSKATNSVSEVHHGVCERMFQGYSFQNVTNGIHLPTWVSDPIRELFQQHFPSWEQEPNQLEQLSQISLQDELLAAHRKNKQDLIDWINVHQEFFPAFDNPSGDDGFDDETLTIAFARRFVAYKRPSLIFQNL
ncbi:MAG: alpha-glucan family phosphorylase, partial [Candidatus Gracilibacteria bacterium]|nr:alpha-glucan family phosphorylase [Candidatus Gracilibacteria bacterium]